MNTDSLNNDKDLKRLMKKGLLDIPHTDFEDKVMQKVLMININQTVVRKNLKASWLFLAVSIILFPAGFLAMFNLLDFTFIPHIGESVNSVLDIFIPAGVLIFSVVIFLQIDNLLRLSFRAKVI